MTPEREAELQGLMILSQRGNGPAYERLLGELRDVVHAFIRKRAGAVSWVDDATQDVLISIHRSRHTWDPRRPFMPWFYAIVTSRLIDGLRRDRRRRAREVAAGEPRLASAPSGANATELTWLAARDAQAALGTLGAQQRQVITRLKLLEQSAAEVSRAMGLTEGHVRVIAHRAMRALQVLMRRHDAIH